MPWKLLVGIESSTNSFSFARIIVWKKLRDKLNGDFLSVTDQETAKHVNGGKKEAIRSDCKVLCSNEN